MFSSKDEDATVKCQTHAKCCIGILYAYSMFTLDIGCYAHACMYMLTWMVEYPKEVILFSGSKQLYFIFQWIRRSVFLGPF